MNAVCNDGKGNMRTLEQKVDILLRYCAAESEQARQHYHADLQRLLTTPRAPDLQGRIDRALADLGIPAHLLGYVYLQAAIELVARQPDAVFSVMLCVYPGVAMRYSTTASLVERAIRHAVERGWSRCDAAAWELYFGGRLCTGHRKPTNAEFIASIANAVRE